MRPEAERIIPKNDRVVTAIAGIAVLAVLTLFTLFHAFTPLTVATIERQLSMNQQ